MSYRFFDKEYIEGLDRNDQHAIVSHLYEGPVEEPGNPMCARGWNRSGGFRYSIFRGNRSDKGTCEICLRRAMSGKSGVEPRERKTRWL